MPNKLCPTILGIRSTLMSVKTRLDSRSENNNSLQFKDKKGNLIAEIKVLDNQSVTLEISTRNEVYIEKNNGWSSIRYKGA